MIVNVPSNWSRYSDQAFQTSKIPEWIMISALTAALIVSDDFTWQMSKGWYDRSHTVRQVAIFFDKLGDGRGQFGLAGAFAAYGLLASDNRALRTASQTVQAILAAGTIVQVLKHITGRESPFTATQPGGVWRFFPNQIDYHKHVPQYDAFPSGHIEAALAAVIVVAENYPEVNWIRTVGYPIVGLIGLGMGHTGTHWYSDYPLGLAFGYAFGMIAAHPEGISLSQQDQSSPVQIFLSPTINAYGGGLSLNISF